MVEYVGESLSSGKVVQDAVRETFTDVMEVRSVLCCAPAPSLCRPATVVVLTVALPVLVFAVPVATNCRPVHRQRPVEGHVDGIEGSGCKPSAWRLR